MYAEPEKDRLWIIRSLIVYEIVSLCTIGLPILSNTTSADFLFHENFSRGTDIGFAHFPATSFLFSSMIC